MRGPPAVARAALVVACLTACVARPDGSSEQCAAGSAECPGGAPDAQRDEDAYNTIQRRCVAKKKACGRALDVDSLYHHMKSCATNDDHDAEEDIECQRSLQEILVLSACGDKGGRFARGEQCATLMESLVFSKIDATTLKTLATVQWQMLFTKSIEWPAAQQGHDNGKFYLQPYRTEEKSEYGRIAYGHRVTKEDFESQRFMGGVDVVTAHQLLMEDYQGAVAVAEKELGTAAFNALPLNYQMVVIDVVMSCGTTNDFANLMDALLKGDRRKIRAELLKKPRRPRSAAVYREFVK